MVFVGHLKDATKIAAVGIGNASVNIFGLAVIIGMNAALNTFVAQGFGAGNISLCIVYLKRSRVDSAFCRTQKQSVKPKRNITTSLGFRRLFPGPES